MESTTVSYKRQKEFHEFVSNAFSELAQFKKEGSQSAFNNLLIKILPEVKRYITKRLNAAITNGNIPRGKYRSDDFLDQLFFLVYEQLDEVENKKYLHPWLFKKADELLENAIVEEEFDSLFFENIDNFSKAEWDSMEEKYGTEADGDRVMLEDLDDISYRKHDYILKNVFLEDSKNEMMAKLDKDLGKENIQRHADMVLQYFPLPMRTVFELFTEQKFELEEIAKIKNMSLPEVEQLVEDARGILEKSFYKRYLFDNKY